MRFLGAALLTGLLSLATCLPASAQGIYTCVDTRGRRLTSDRPIIECLDREQRVMNKDGSTRTVLPPSIASHRLAIIDSCPLIARS